MKLLLDEHFSPRLAGQLRRRGHDVVAVAELAEIRQKPDETVMEWAAVEERTLVTEDVADYLRLHQRYRTDGRRHSGLILTTRRRFPRNEQSIGRLVSALDEFLALNDPPVTLDSEVHWL